MENPAARPAGDPFADVTFKDAVVVHRDLSGLVVRTGDLSGLRVVDSALVDVSLDGWVENLDERVGGEWSFVENQRHLVLATDCWFGRALRGEAHPFHPLGLPDTSWPQARAEAEGLDVAATPTLDEVLEVRAGRLARLRAYLADLTDEGLEATVPGRPHDELPADAVLTVRECLGTVVEEECEHHRYVARDLAVLEARQA